MCGIAQRLDTARRGQTRINEHHLMYPRSKRVALLTIHRWQTRQTKRHLQHGVIRLICRCPFQFACEFIGNGKANLMRQCRTEQRPGLVRLKPVSNQVEVNIEVECVEWVLTCTAELDSEIEIGGLLPIGEGEETVGFQFAHMDEDRPVSR